MARRSNTLPWHSFWTQHWKTVQTLVHPSQPSLDDAEAEPRMHQASSGAQRIRPTKPRLQEKQLFCFFLIKTKTPGSSLVA